ncbi:unnamed protein product [Caenorhabditis angaria]|uniref:Uncharacterized protein n=1 Tax=Caenorhabditis angaria TaxID=860376 RepID=A0A9P1N228_9PELO|nr:unnamed protein product [Caenorhabditis angaria]
MVSLHTFNLWSKFAASSTSSFPSTVLFCHVACQESPDFCNGLNSDDYNTVVAYKNGINIGKTANIGDLIYYEQWVELILNEPTVEVEDIVETKKGFWRAKKRNAVTIGVFRSSEDAEYKHFRIAAEKLAGKYYLAHAFVDQDPTISTYRPSEKQKRQSYSGRFDPASIMDFITKSTLPTIFDISQGFTTDLLLRQKRTILLNFGAKIDGNFEKLAGRKELRKTHNFVFLKKEKEDKKKVFENLGISDESDGIVILNKDRVHFIDSKIARCPDHLLKLIQNKAEAEAEKVLSTKEAHPLRYLQVEKVNEIFGFEETIVLPDHTLFLDKDPFSKPSPIPSNPSGGCPFMQGGGGSQTENHDEL